MIHTSRTVTVGKMESVINEPIMLYRGDREVEIEFNIVGSKFMFSNGGNVIKSTNATNGQLVINTPTGENMFSEVTECNDGKVVCVITKEMIDELAEVGFYSFQIRLFDESQVSRVTIPPVYQGIEIRNPIAAEDETDLVDIGLVDFSVVRKDNYENVVTFLPNGDYNKTLWEEHDVISKDRLNKVEDALYEINKGTEGLYPTFQNQYDEFSAKVDKDVKAYKEEMEDEVEQFERDMTQAFGEFKVDYRDDMYNRLDVVEGELDEVNSQLAENEIKIKSNDMNFVNINKYLDEGYSFVKSIELSFNESQNVVVDFGEYEISETIIIPRNKTINFNNAILKVKNDVNVLDIKRSSTVENFKIVVSISNFTKSCVYLDGLESHSVLSNTVIKNGVIEGHRDKKGKAIYFNCTNTQTSSVVSACLKNITIQNFETGILLESTQKSNYINGNKFYNINMYNCEEFIILKDENSAGMDNNIFKDIGIQPSSNSKKCIYISGSRNAFDVSLWDIGLYPDIISFDFSPKARNNNITTRGGTASIINNNGMNKINNFTNGLESNIIINGRDKTQTGTTEYVLRNYIGNQDNVLANGHKKYTVTIEGKSPDSINRAFSLNPSQYCSWTSLTSDDEIVINIDLTNDTLKYGCVIGCTFVYGAIPDYIKIETISASETRKTIREENSFSGGYIYETNSIPDIVKNIIFTMKRINGTSIRVGKFFAGANGTKGNHFVDTSGGNIYGNLVFENGTGNVLTSPNGTKWRQTIDDDGVASWVKI